MIDLTPTVIAAALGSGALVGLFLAVFGGGGSVLAAPLLLYAVGVRDPHVAIGTASAAVAANAAVSLMGHWKGGRVKWPCAISFGLAGLLGSLTGSTIAKQVPGDALLLAFAGAMAAIALSMFRKPKSEGDPDVHLTRAILLKLIPLGLIVGFAAGFFGIGGGFLIVPGLVMATGMTLANAMASSLVSVALFGASTSANYALTGQVAWPLVGLLLGGGVLGGLVGLQIAKLLQKHTNVARRGFAVLILLVAGYVAVRALNL